MVKYRVISTLSTRNGYVYPGQIVPLAEEAALKLVHLGVVTEIEDEKIEDEKIEDEKIEDDIEENGHASND